MDFIIHILNVMTTLYVLPVAHDLTQAYNIAGAIMIEIWLTDDETGRVVPRGQYVPVTTTATTHQQLQELTWAECAVLLVILVRDYNNVCSFTCAKHTAHNKTTSSFKFNVEVPT